MQPLGPIEDTVPVVLISRGNRHRRVGAIIDHIARTLIGAGFQEVEPQTARVGAQNELRVDADGPQRVHGRLGQRVLGQSRDIAGRAAIVADGRRHARLGPRVGHF